MIITWQGHSCFKIQNKVGSEGTTVVTDPFDKKIGLKVPNFEADIVTISHDHPNHNNASVLRAKPMVIDTAGEYDFKGILVEGIDTVFEGKNDKKEKLNIIYRIEIDNISITHLGDLNHTLNDHELEKLVGTDILLIPVGGESTLDAKKAVEIIAQIEPRIVIPMHYKIKGSKADVDGVDKFVKELGLEPSYEDKLKIYKKDLPQEDRELVILNFK